MKQFPAIAQTFILTSFSFSALSLFASAPTQAASFRGLGWLPNTLTSYASDVSADGSVVVGSSRNANGYDEAFRWTQGTGMVGLGVLDSNNQYRSSSANGVSADGSVVVGSSEGQAFRWTQSGGMVGLGGSSDTANDGGSSAADVSADGSVVVGYDAQEAFRWTQSGGMISLGSLPNGIFDWATRVSADGSVVVGYSLPDDLTEMEPFRWTQSGGMVRLVDFPGSVIPNGVSADGSVIVGDAYVYDGIDGIKAFRWTESGGIVGLGHLPGGSFDSFARGISADGSIIVGTSSESGWGLSPKAFRWTQETGMVSLKETLIGEGLDVSGWTLSSAQAISADGFTIVGNGINPSGQSEAWVANLEPVPEPLTILGSMAAIAFAASFERKFSKNKSEEKDPDA